MWVELATFYLSVLCIIIFNLLSYIWTQVRKDGLIQDLQLKNKATDFLDLMYWPIFFFVVPLVMIFIGTGVLIKSSKTGEKSFILILAVILVVRTV